LRERIRGGYLDGAGVIFKPSGRCCRRSLRSQGKLLTSKFLVDSLSVKKVQTIAEMIGDPTTDQSHPRLERLHPIVRLSRVHVSKNNA
jgi:hypothetical protein